MATKAEIESMYQWLLAEKSWQANELAKRVDVVTGERDKLVRLITPTRPYIG